MNELCRWCEFAKSSRHEPHKPELNNKCACRNHSISTNILVKQTSVIDPITGQWKTIEAVWRKI